MTTPAARRGRRSAADVADRIEAIRRLPEAPRKLTAMLAEQSQHFAGRGTNEAERLRGWILASFETVGLPREAVPYVLEELETGQNPYTVAAAARALRGASEVPAEAPALLVGAIARLSSADDFVSFERFEPAPAGTDSVTALAELTRTLAVLGPSAKPALAELNALVAGEGEAFSPALRRELARAAEALARPDVSAPDCCCAEDSEETAATPAAPLDLDELDLEDQDGTRLSFAEAFAGRPTALAFFYTRCMNPEKCSLTVTRLGRLARRVAENGLDANVAGISYDPGFDRPARLKTYGADRGMAFSSRCSLLRTVGPFEPLREALDLGVGFGPVTVNRHRLDLVVLDAPLGVVQRFERRVWHEDSVLDALRVAGEPTPVGEDGAHGHPPGR